MQCLTSRHLTLLLSAFIIKASRYREEVDTLKFVISIIALVFVAILAIAPSANAANAANGAAIFSNNCAACHAGGRNVVNPAKTLSQSDLEKYSMNSIEAIKTQVTNGKAAMPAFGGRLTPEQIEDVSAYVLEKSASGW